MTPKNDERGAGGKVLLYDYDYIFGLTNNACMVCLTDREIAWILTNLDYGHWAARWHGSYSKDNADALIDGLAGKLMDSFCNDVTGALYQIQIAQIDILNLQRISVYVAENPQTIDTNNPPEGSNFEAGGGGGDTGDGALCIAAEAYVRHKLDETIKLYTASLGAAAVATGVLAALTGGLGAIFGGVVVIVAGVALANVTDAAADNAAIHNVSCQLYGALKGAVATEANFVAAIDSLTGSTANQATIVNILQAGAGSGSYLGGTQRLSNYLHFLQLLGGSVVSVQAGLAECLCNTWCYEWDLKVDDHSPDLIINNGHWSSGQGFVCDAPAAQLTFEWGVATQVGTWSVQDDGVAFTSAQMGYWTNAAHSTYVIGSPSYDSATHIWTLAINDAIYGVWFNWYTAPKIIALHLDGENPNPISEPTTC